MIRSKIQQPKFVNTRIDGHLTGPVVSPYALWDRFHFFKATKEIWWEVGWPHNMGNMGLVLLHRKRIFMLNLHSSINYASNTHMGSAIIEALELALLLSSGIQGGKRATRRPVQQIWPEMKNRWEEFILTILKADNNGLPAVALVTWCAHRSMRYGDGSTEVY